MYSKVLVVLAFAAWAGANDLYIAASNNTEGHEKIYDEHIEVQWAITRQTKEVSVNASNGVVCLINVTDLRANKDGEARITSGGIGQKNVTITLSSPAAFRGFDFRVEVYSDMHEEHEVGRGHRDVEVPEEIPETPENKTAKPVTETVPSTTEVTTVTGVTGATEIPEVTTGKPARHPTTDKPATVTVHRAAEVPVLEMGMDRVPKGAEQPPEMQAFVDFKSPRHG